MKLGAGRGHCVCPLPSSFSWLWFTRTGMMIMNKKQVLILVSDGFPDALIMSLLSGLDAAARPAAVVGFSRRAVTGAEGASLEPDVSLEDLLHSNGSLGDAVLAIPPGSQTKQRLQIDPRAEGLIVRLLERRSAVLAEGGSLAILTKIMPAAGPLLTPWHTAEPGAALAQLLALGGTSVAHPLASAAYATD